MSTDVELVDEKGKKCLVDKHKEGGTYDIEGTTKAELNITYNYAWFYYKFLDKKKGLHYINGKKAKDCIPKLKKCIRELTTPRTFGCGVHNYNKDYWAPTAGNACHAIKILLKWAEQHPNAKFKTKS